MTIFQIKNSIEAVITTLVAVYMWYALDVMYAMLAVMITFIPMMVFEWPDMVDDVYRPVRWLMRAVLYLVTLLVALMVESTANGFSNTAKAGADISTRNYEACQSNISEQVNCSEGYQATQDTAKAIVDTVDVFNTPFGLEVTAVSFVIISSVVAYVLATLIFFVICKFKD